jgi:LysM repeat protein
MNSIRPLVTITILVVVGAYLYVKINEGPARPEGENDVWQSEIPEGVPPLDVTAESASAGNNAAPFAAPAIETVTTPAAIDNSPATLNATPLAPATSEVSTSGGVVPGAAAALPAIPAIPELPAPETSANAGPPSGTASVPLPNSLPENIPVARYPDELGPTDVNATSAGAATNDVNQRQALPQTIPATTTQAGAATDSSNASSHAGLTSVPTAPGTAIPQASSPAPNPLRQTVPPTTPTDPYGSSVYAPGTPTNDVSADGKPSFAASWPAIQAELDRGELARALELLSPWHEDPSLTPAQAQQVETLLSQLAGTVVYSTEHQLEPARVVVAGETLETVAKEYNVPWQLLAKINGIPARDQLRPGQELKVVRGPFSAVVDLNRKRLTLMVDGRYAGTFPVTGTSSLPVGEGEWVVRGSTESARVVMLARPNTTATSALESVFVGPTAALEQLGVPVMVGLSDSDANEVADILSVGSPVVIRR